MSHFGEVRSFIKVYYSSEETACVVLRNQDKLSNMRGDARNSLGYVPILGRCTESILGICPS